jgi:hypothetical protein
VPNLKDLNLCLLGSWVKRFIKDEKKPWRGIIERKYCENDSIFYVDKNWVSPFWKGVMLAAQAIKFGYRWMVGNGRKIPFWEDIWFGTAPLAVQFWELYCIFLFASRLYCIYNEKRKSIGEVWDNETLKLSFRRTFSDQMMLVWDDLRGVVSSLVLKEEPDTPIWNYSISGIYSSQSCYAIINFRGVTPIYIPAMWYIKVPLKFICFYGSCPTTSWPR